MTGTSAKAIRAAGEGLSPRTTWAGYAAFAWGAFFAVEHLYWVLAGRFERELANQDPWSGAISAIFSVVLSGLLALFPLALVWPFRGPDRRRLQVALLVTGYGTMISLNLVCFLFSWSGPWSGFGLYLLGICVVGGLVAFVRPRRQGIARRMVLVATWALGAGMTLYGGAYVYLAFLQPTFEEFLGYFFVGGMNWTIEGLLFVATAYLVSCESHASGQTGASLGKGG